MIGPRELPQVGADGVAHLPGMLAARTLAPVLGVPVPGTRLDDVQRERAEGMVLQCNAS